jgi:hypothetical protein
MAFAQLNEQIQQKDQQLIECKAALQDARSHTAELLHRNWQLVVERDRAVEEISKTEKRLQELVAAREDEIEALQEALENGQATDREINGRLLLTDEVYVAGNPVMEKLSNGEKQALQLFYQGEDISAVCARSGGTPPAIFALLHRLFCRPNCRLLNGITVPTNWQLDQKALVAVTNGSSFLFSTRIFDLFFSCGSSQDLVTLLGAAFEEFSQYPERQWQFMAVFVLEMAFARVVYDAATIDRQEAQIARLRSLRGKLTRRCRTRKEEYEAEIAALTIEVRQLRNEVAQLQKALSAKENAEKPIFYSDSQIWADVFCEMIELAQMPKEARRYSDHLYYVAVVILFRSASTFEFLRHFLPLPSAVSVYAEFHDPVNASLDRLQSVDKIVPFLCNQIELDKEIADGVTLAVDAVSCSNVFVGMKHVQRSEIAYLFVVYLQPLCPDVKCVPLFVIPTPEGIGNPIIQRKIDEVLRLTRSCIPRVFLASDGDPSYNTRHNTFFAYWTNLFAQIGLDGLLRELENYCGDLPLSDLLHLAKCLRTRILVYLLTFVSGHGNKTINQERIREILGLKAPLTDLTPLGKMRDAYPLAITRVENIVALIDQDAIVEAIILLPMTLCFAATRLETIPRDTRSHLLRIAFFLVLQIREMRQSGLDKLPETVKKKNRHKQVTIFTSQWSTRFLDTAVWLMFSVEKYRKLAFDRLGTHPEENFFGFVRWDSDDINTADRMIHTIAHTDIVKEAGRALGLEEKIRKRANLGGAQYDDDNQPAKMCYIQVPPELDAEMTATICLSLAMTYPDCLSDFVEKRFQSFVEYLRTLAIAERVSERNSESDQQFICGSGSRIMSGLKSHQPPKPVELPPPIRIVPPPLARNS